MLSSCSLAVHGQRLTVNDFFSRRRSQTLQLDVQSQAIIGRYYQVTADLSASLGT
jgi:hypothetical protein